MDLSAVSGTGPGGRILASDLQGAQKKTATAGAAAAAGGKDGDYVVSLLNFPLTLFSIQDIPLTNMRRTIAKRLTESKSTIPHYYLTSEIALDNILQ